MLFERRHTVADRSPYDDFTWETRTARIDAADGSNVVTVEGITVPTHWSDHAANILAAKYCRRVGVPDATRPVPEADVPAWLWRSEPAPDAASGAERDARDVFDRIAGCWTYHGWQQGVFDDEVSAHVFFDEVRHGLADQRFAPNSPQWFNTGLHWKYGIDAPAQGHWREDPQDGLKPMTSAYAYPQTHACVPLDAPVWTPDGTIPIAELRTVGDRPAVVWDGFGWTDVLAFAERGERDILRIHFRGGDSLVATGDHLVATRLAVVNSPWTDRPLATVQVGSFLGRSIDMGRSLQTTQPRKPQPFGGIVSSEVVRIEEAGKAAVCDIQTRSGYYTVYGHRVHNCFILEAADNLTEEHGILTNVVTEGRIFAHGSGAGSNLSAIRGTGEPLSGGGVSSGLMSFTRIDDVAAGAIKSGGRTRRSSKLKALDPDHPEIEEFIAWKVKEEQKVASLVAGSRLLDRHLNRILQAVSLDGESDPRANKALRHALLDARDAEIPETCLRHALDLARQGITRIDVPVYDTQWTGEGYASVSGQNANNSVSARNVFLQAVEDDDPWNLYWRTELLTARTEGRPPLACKTLPARQIFHGIATASWYCGDPGLQFRDTINEWHTCPAGGEITGTNPCCFTYETPVETSEGKIPIGQLAEMCDRGGELPYAFAFDLETGRPVLRQIKRAWKAGATTKLFEVETERFVFRCTPGHRFLTHDGRYVEAAKLEVGDRLRLVDRPDGGIEDQGRRTEQPPTSPGPGAIVSPSLHPDDNSEPIQVIARRHYNAPYPLQVYDLEVDGTHNFTISNAKTPDGVVVSNSEYIFLSDTSCNLASINVRRSAHVESGDFAVADFRHDVRLMTVALEITVGMGQYPTAAIAHNTYRYRTLGLGYSNVGACLMLQGIPYDSSAGRNWIGAVTALLNAHAYHTSAELARDLGPFETFNANREAMLRVLRNHRRAGTGATGGYEGLTIAPVPLDRNYVPTCLWDAIQDDYRDALEFGERYGYRNAQVTVIAPCGTISFVMDCDTTGIEPDHALIKHKSLAGGGVLRIVNQAIAPALRQLGYDASRVAAILAHVDENETIEGAPGLNPLHLAVFDCAYKTTNGTRFLAPESHVAMLSVVQPHISGGISKTIGSPEQTTIAQIEGIYLKAWKLGLKSVSVYRDGSKLSAPLSRDRPLDLGVDDRRREIVREVVRYEARRRPLPSRRNAFVQQAKIGGLSGQSVFITTGHYDDGRLGEVFINSYRGGAPFQAMLELIGKLISKGLQFGLPLREFIDSMFAVAFAPQGIVIGDEHNAFAHSLIDYLARYLAIHYDGQSDLISGRSRSTLRPDRVVPVAETVVDAEGVTGLMVKLGRASGVVSGYSGEICPQCHQGLVRRTGTCLYCEVCDEPIGGCG